MENPFQRKIAKGPRLEDLKVFELAGKRYYQRPDGTWVPSVTTILSEYKNEALLAWRERVGEEEAKKIMNIAARRGTVFHEMCELFLSNGDLKTFYQTCMPDSQETFKQAFPFLKRINNIRYIEAPLYSTRMDMAGRVDCVADFDNVLSIIDFKSSLMEKKESWIVNYFEQETAYSEMLEERTGIHAEQIVTVMTSLYENEATVFVKNREPYLYSLHHKVYEYRKLHKSEYSLL